MFRAAVRPRLFITLTVAMVSGGLLVCGQTSEMLSHPKMEGWPGQIRAYKAFSEMLSAEDIGARQDPDHAQRHRTDFHEILGLTQDEVGDLWATMLGADRDCESLDSGYYVKYPAIPLVQALESAKNGPELSSIEVKDAAAKKREAFTELNQKKDLVIENAIAELKLQLGHDDFDLFDRWVHEHFAPVHHPQHHPAIRRQRFDHDQP